MAQQPANDRRKALREKLAQLAGQARSYLVFWLVMAGMFAFAIWLFIALANVKRGQ